jgi:ParB-like chromosome segregation protein Spo0J
MQIKTFKIQDLIEYARNPRKNDEVVDKMISCIKEFGFRIPIVAKSDGTIVDGHLRLKAAKKLGLEEVPVVVADDLTETQIKAFRLVANQSANWAEWDDELLKLELEDLKNLNFDLDLTGFDLNEVERLLKESFVRPAGANVWDYAGMNSFSSDGELLKMHPTVKPVKLVADAILDCSLHGELILDLFGGSGTTLIAGEETDRKCRMMELDPKYVDTIIRRWQKHTRRQAIHAITGKPFSEAA